MRIVIVLLIWCFIAVDIGEYGYVTGYNSLLNEELGK